MSEVLLAGAHSLVDDWPGALEASLARLSLPPGANLGFVYFSDRHAEHAEAMLARLREATGIEEWVGSVGIGICGTGSAAVDAGGIALLAGRFPEGGFRVFSGRQPLTGGAEPYFAVVHADPGTPDMGDLVMDMASKVSSGFVTGGLSSSHSKSVQIADGVLAGGISGVAFGESVPVATRLTQGCSPLPGRHVITEAERNIIGRIDGRPALEVYKEAVGEVLARDMARAAHYVLAGLPVAGRDAGDYLARNVIGVDPKNGLIAINELVEKGRPLLFLRRDATAAREDMHRMLGELRDSLPGPPKGGLYFSCLARGGNMFGEDSVEPRLIRAAFGDIPLAGFFCNGEISHDQLYGYTGVLTLFL
ncbi:MAG TPA: FIST C-terminal domain-containing protein [Rhodocyclaceae bacterium]|nr:FIST C-terminal domain-containing protein [Rhodocyclaceae bacterium]